jgi:methyl-accepting chemotaxis protein
VSVRAVPDASKFPAELKAELEKTEAKLRVELPVSLGRSDIVADARRLAAMAEAAAQVQLATLLDTTGVEQQVKATREQVKRSPVELPVKLGDPVDAAFQARVKGDLRKLAATLELNVPAGVQGEVLRRQVAAQITAVEKSLAVEVPTKPGDAAEYRRRLQDQLRLVERAVEFTVPVDVDLDVPAKEQAEVVTKVGATRQLLQRNPIRIPLDVDTAPLRALAGQITSLGGTLTGLGVGAVAGQATAGGLVALASALAQTAAALALIPAAGVAAIAVSSTLKLGLHGVNEALTAETPKAYAEALKNISPEARKLVGALREMAPEARAFREAIQDRLLTGLADDAERIADVYLPTLRRGLGGIADEINAGVVDLGKFARETRSIRVVRDALDDSARASGLLAEAIRPAASGVRALVDVGSDFLPGLAAQVAVLAERWSVMVERSADDGRLREWISQALDNIGDLAGIVGNIGRIFGAAFRAGDAEGRQLLDTVRDITKQIADFANGAEGQEALGSFLGAAGDLAEALLPLLRSVVMVIGNDLAPLLSRVGVTLVPALVSAVDAIGSALGLAAPGIEKFAAGIASLITDLADSGAIDAVGKLAGVVGGALGDALTRIGPQLAELVTAVADELSGALPGVVSGVAGVAVALGEMLTAGAPLIGFLGRLLTDVGLPVLQRVAQNLTPIIRDLVTWLSEGSLSQKLPEIADGMVAFVDELAPLVDGLLDTGKELVDALVPHMDDIIGSLKGLAQAALPVAKALAAIAGAISFVSENIDDMTEKVPGLQAALGDKGLFGTLSSFTTPIGPLKGLYDSVSGLTKIMQGEFPDAERTFVDGLGRIGEGSRVTFEELRARGTEGILGLLGIVQENAPLLTDVFLTNLFTMQDGQRSIFGQMLADLTDHWGRMDAEIAERTFGISDKVDSAWKRVAESTRREWEETERRVAEGINNAASETSKLPGRVRDSLGNIAGTLYPSGSSLIAGFISGMKAQEYAARQAAEAVMRIVAGAFPSSPAKYGPFSGTGWTPYRGAALVEGFAEGMTSSIASAVRAAEQVTTAVSDRLPTAGGSGTGLGGGGVNLTQYIYPQPGQSEESIAMASSRGLAQLVRTR